MKPRGGPSTDRAVRLRGRRMPGNRSSVAAPLEPVDERAIDRSASPVTRDVEAALAASRRGRRWCARRPRPAAGPAAQPLDQPVGVPHPAGKEAERR